MFSSNVRWTAAGYLINYICSLILQITKNKFWFDKKNQTIQFLFRHKISMFKSKKKLFERQTSTTFLLRIEAENQRAESRSLYEEILQRSLNLMPNSEYPNLNARILNLVGNWLIWFYQLDFQIKLKNIVLNSLFLLTIVQSCNQLIDKAPSLTIYLVIWMNNHQ